MDADWRERSGGGTWDRERLLEALETYRRGLSDAPLLQKWGEGEVRAGEDGPARTMSFVISTDEVDRHGDVIVPEGWRLEAYRRNPVFLWAHDYTRPVIGKAVSVWQEAHSLLARMEFAPTEFAQEVALLYRSNYQRGVSVGFRPLVYEERRHEKTGVFLGIRFVEQELLEVSAVPVPANRSALRRGGEDTPRMRDYWRRWEQARGRGQAPASLEAAWPELAARVDDLGKLAAELAEMMAAVEAAGASDPGDVAGMLSALGEARW
jgi:HK97 family phage prohead protease